VALWGTDLIKGQLKISPYLLMFKIKNKKMNNNSNGLWLNRNSKKICYNPWTHFEVNNPNGDVTMCCDVPTVLGNVNEQSIEEIWNGQKYQRMRRMMFDRGAEAVCGPQCPLINGMKNYQSFSWYQNIPRNHPLFLNAELNEKEICEGKEILKSKPRWMRFALSYKCNFSCYHCYQKDERKDNIKLPPEFLENMKELAPYYQVLFIFGGEPTIFPEFKDLLSLADIHPHLRLALVTNASNLHKYLEKIKKVNWLFIAVSLDAASPEVYQNLRNSHMWEQVNNNIRLISELKRERSFEFNISMTMNNKNCQEIYDFVKLSDSYGATPKISLVSNPDGLAFHAKYLWFNKNKRKNILSQVEKLLNEFNDKSDAIGLNMLKRQFDQSNVIYYYTQMNSILKNITPAPLIELAKRSMTLLYKS
jgi:MoaA/NifB/PqqE/SkfB family radical SAM enzyme